MRRSPDAWRVGVPVLLLIAVAMTQAVLVRRADLSPWKGGGFGMFAAVDGGAVRTVRITLEEDGRRELLQVPPSLATDAERATAFPADGFLARLAERVVAREHRHGRSVRRVTVEAWSATLTADGSYAEARRLRTYVHEVAPADHR